MGDLLKLFLFYYLIPFSFIYSYQLLFTRKVDPIARTVVRRVSNDTYEMSNDYDAGYTLLPGQLHGKTLFLVPLGVGGAAFLILVIMYIFKTAQDTITKFERFSSYVLLVGLITAVVSFILFLIIRIRHLERGRVWPILLFIPYLAITIPLTVLALSSLR